MNTTDKSSTPDLTPDSPTPDQYRAIAAIRDSGIYPVAICGYAGTGKSWLAAHAVPGIFAGRRLVYAAPTNKASRGILRSNLRKAGLKPSSFPAGRERLEEGFTEPVSLGTVFSLLNIPRTEWVCASTGQPCEDGSQCERHEADQRLTPAGTPATPCEIRESELRRDPRQDPLNGAEVIIIDEASMLSRDEHERLCSECAERGIKLLMFGDPGQLPPVGERESSALLNPAIVMEDIVRQQAGNPIIALATLARNGQYLQPWSWSPLVHVLGPQGPDVARHAGAYFAEGAANQGNMIICPRHDGNGPGGRTWHNHAARQALGFTSPWPQPGDAVVSVSNDYYLWRAFNGSRGAVIDASAPFEYAGQQVIEMIVRFSRHRDPRRFLALAGQFGWPGNGSPGGRKVPATVPLRPSFKRELELASARPGDLDGKELKMLRDDREPLLRLDYGYALTAWKAQGDEAPGVLVTGASQALPHVDRKRYLYTAITRARFELVII